ncbi:general transcription factor 3C polypeptide 6 [Bombina bombina]|uniref:general transcription factor 3C polypeptide 6 n=1 Tax=Bombina bombina TaxID=8345 RepID=UPI00235AE89B|nr:general transcription factor 3C polypeptide 6 [Bombina bombina]
MAALSDAVTDGNPGYQSEDEEEEEQLVLVELTGIIDSDILKNSDNKCKILGMNTDKPFLQVDKYVFAGEYEDALGTFVIFEETSNQGDDNEKTQLKYKCHTAKKLNMTRTFLSEKKENDSTGDKVEVFQIKDELFSSWSQMLCSFAQENMEGEEQGEESQSEEEQLDESTEDTGNLDQSFDVEKQNSDNSDSKGKEMQEPSVEGQPSLGLEDNQDSEVGEKQDLVESESREDQEPQCPERGTSLADNGGSSCPD